MPLFTVLRHFPGATRADLDAAAFRSLSCLMYHPGLAWVRSYWSATTETLTCIYEAVDEEQIRLHAQRAALPCDAVDLVEEVLPSEFTSDAPSTSAIETPAT